MDTETTIRSAIEAYDAKDMDRVAELVSDNVCYRINSQAATGPYRADCHDKEAFFAAVGEILADWNIVHYRIADLIVSGNRGAAQIDLRIASLHIDHGFDARLALFLTVEDGQLSEIVEYHDTWAVSTARSGWVSDG